jgi:hypothetical protein
VPRNQQDEQQIFPSHHQRKKGGTPTAGKMVASKISQGSTSSAKQTTRLLGGLKDRLGYRSSTSISASTDSPGISNDWIRLLMSPCPVGLMGMQGRRLVLDAG